MCGKRIGQLAVAARQSLQLRKLKLTCSNTATPSTSWERRHNGLLLTWRICSIHSRSCAETERYVLGYECARSCSSLPCTLAIRFESAY